MFSLTDLAPSAGCFLGILIRHAAGPTSAPKGPVRSREHLTGRVPERWAVSPEQFTCVLKKAGSRWDAHSTSRRPTPCRMFPYHSHFEGFLSSASLACGFASRSVCTAAVFPVAPHPPLGSGRMASSLRHLQGPRGPHAACGVLPCWPSWAPLSSAPRPRWPLCGAPAAVPSKATSV